MNVYLGYVLLDSLLDCVFLVSNVYGIFLVIWISHISSRIICPYLYISVWWIGIASL